MLVYFLRHASAGQRKLKPATDEKRPLDKDGIEQCQYVGRALAALDVHVDLIISSPLKRATQTAALIANELAYDNRIEIAPALRPEAAYPQFRDLLNRHSSQDAIMVVGHNPNLSDFFGRVIGGGARASLDLKKAGVARVEVDHNRGTLNWYITPKLIRTLYEASASNSRPKTARK